MLSFAVTEPPAPACVVRVEKGSIARMSVTPTSGAPFDVRLTDVPLTLTPPASADSPTWIDVRGLFELSGKASSLFYRPTKPLDLASGMIHVGTNGRITALRSAGAGVEKKTGLARIAVGGETSVEDVPIACDALTLADDRWPPPAYVGPDDAYSPLNAEWRLFASPGSASSIAISGVPPLAILGKKGAWAHVRIAVEDETRITGWIRADEIDEGAWGVGYGIGLCGRGCAVGFASTSEGEYEGKARVARGTSLHAAPGGGAWATLARDAELGVFHARGDEWVRITETPGISDDPDCDENTHAYVPVGAVTFAPGVRLERAPSGGLASIPGRPDRAR